jgi:hypothetical protein
VHITGKNRELALYVIVVLVVAAVLYWFNTQGLLERIAVKGAGPQNYIAEELHPDNFVKNYQTAGIGKYQYSLPMNIFLYLEKHIGIPVNTTIYPYMFIQIVFFLAAVALLSHTLFANPIVTILSIIIIPVCSLAGLNLSRFGSGYGSLLSFPLFYGYANAFRLLTLSFFLKKRYTIAALSLAFSVFCHVNMGMFMLFFIGCSLAWRPSLCKDRKLITGLLIFAVLTIPFIFHVLTSSSVVTSTIPPEDWIKSTRLFSFHWYPVTMRLFTQYAHWEFFPLLILTSVWLILLYFTKGKSQKYTGIMLSGLIGCLLFSTAGVVFSDLFSMPFIIKVSPQRISGILSFLGVFYLINYLTLKCQEKTFWLTFSAGYLMLCLILVKPGIALLPLLLLLHNDFTEQYSEGKLSVFHIIILLRTTILFLIILGLLNSIGFLYPTVTDNLNRVLWAPLLHINPLGKSDFLLFGGALKVEQRFFILSLSLLFLYSLWRHFRWNQLTKKLNYLIGAISIVGLSALVFLVSCSGYYKWHTKSYDFSSSFRDAQIWAKENSPNSALFLTDPSQCYGWRDFSQRSSFGCYRDWGYASITYSPELQIYLEGKRRLALFGVDLDTISNQDVADLNYGIGGNIIQKTINQNFHTMSEGDFTILAEKNGINYVVMKKTKQRKKFPSLLLAYSNDHFNIYKF